MNLVFPYLLAKISFLPHLHSLLLASLYEIRACIRLALQAGCFGFVHIRQSFLRKKEREKKEAIIAIPSARPYYDGGWNEGYTS